MTQIEVQCSNPFKKPEEHMEDDLRSFMRAKKNFVDTPAEGAV